MVYKLEQTPKSTQPIVCKFLQFLTNKLLSNIHEFATLQGMLSTKNTL
jgi:hypothetical protein